MDNTTIDKLAKKVWDYHHLNHQLEKADCIIVLGSHDIRTADRGIELYRAGYAPLILFSGGLGRLTKNVWTETEAERFAKIAIEAGIPQSNILIEDQSTNTSENIRFSMELLRKHGIEANSVILVHKPYMERRTYATFMKLFPEVKAVVTSPNISYGNYPNNEISKEEMINVMVGDLQRIKEYPAKGFQIEQEIPADIWEANNELTVLGYTEHILKEKKSTDQHTETLNLKE